MQALPLFFFFSNSFLDNNVLYKWLLKVLLQLFPSNSCALYGAHLRGGIKERPPWPSVVGVHKEAALMLLGGSECLNADGCDLQLNVLALH